MKYIIALGLLAITATSQAQLREDPYEAWRLQRQLDEIQEQTRRINNQLRDERDARFYDAMRHGDTRGMLDNMN